MLVVWGRSRDAPREVGQRRGRCEEIALRLRASPLPRQREMSGAFDARDDDAQIARARLIEKRNAARLRESVAVELDPRDIRQIWAGGRRGVARVERHGQSQRDQIAQPGLRVRMRQRAAGNVYVDTAGVESAAVGERAAREKERAVEDLFHADIDRDAARGPGIGAPRVEVGACAISPCPAPWWRAFRATSSC